MNYFGHAAVAAYFTDQPAIVLGSMLPDFTSMLSINLSDLNLKRRLQALESSAKSESQGQFYRQLTQGVELHLLTDAKFHPLQFFVEWNRKALKTFRAAGVRRGPSRATAHIGVEMAIDAGLKEQAKHADAYMGALAYGVEKGHYFAGISVEARPFIKFFDHLYQKGPALHSRERERYDFRFSRMLAGRPHLAPSQDELNLITQYFTDAAMEIEPLVPELMKELVAEIRLSDITFDDFRQNAPA